MIYITNAFSLAMLDDRAQAFHVPIHVNVERIGPKDVRRILNRHPNYVSTYGHINSARHLEKLLGHQINVSRKMLRLLPGDKVIVCGAIYRDRDAKKDADKVPAWWIFHLVSLYEPKGQQHDY